MKSNPGNWPETQRCHGLEFAERRLKFKIKTRAIFSKQYWWHYLVEPWHYLTWVLHYLHPIAKHLGWVSNAFSVRALACHYSHIGPRYDPTRDGNDAHLKDGLCAKCSRTREAMKWDSTRGKWRPPGLSIFNSVWVPSRHRAFTEMAAGRRQQEGGVIGGQRRKSVIFFFFLQAALSWIHPAGEKCNNTLFLSAPVEDDVSWAHTLSRDPRKSRLCATRHLVTQHQMHVNISTHFLV